MTRPASLFQCHQVTRRAGRAASVTGERMSRLLRVLLVVVALAIVALVAYAYLGELDPVREEVTVPVEIDVD